MAASAAALAAYTDLQTLIDDKSLELDDLKSQVEAIDALSAGRNALAAFEQDAENAA
jgi:hypothetical protein